MAYVCVRPCVACLTVCKHVNIYAPYTVLSQGLLVAVCTACKT